MTWISLNTSNVKSESTDTFTDSLCDLTNGNNLSPNERKIHFVDEKESLHPTGGNALDHQFASIFFSYENSTLPSRYNKFLLLFFDMNINIMIAVALLLNLFIHITQAP